MEALVPAFIAALVTQFGDRSAWLAAAFADRYRRPLTVALAAGLAHALGNGLAALGAGLVAPMLTPNAKALLIALALLLGGAGALFPMGKLDRLGRWRTGPFVTAFLGIFILALGDRTQFLTFALAAGSGTPWLAAAGAALGASAVGFVATVIGEAGWRALPQRGWRIASGVAMLGAGAIIGLGALRLT